jgi:hypothetical protein
MPAKAALWRQVETVRLQGNVSPAMGDRGAGAGYREAIAIA